MAKIERILLEDRRITIRQLAAEIPEASEASIDRILNEKLGYHKVCARWVPHMHSALRFGWEVIAHPSYSPNDFHLFPKLKEHLGGQRFETDKELQVSKFLNGLAAEFFEAGMQKWITRQKKCVDKNGDYVEN